MPSLFEEQLERDELAVRLYFELGMGQFAKTLSEKLELDRYNTGPANYLAEIKRAKKAISIPVIGGLNGLGLGNWVRMRNSSRRPGPMRWSSTPTSCRPTPKRTPCRSRIDIWTSWRPSGRR